MSNDLTRPIVGIENRTAQEVFDIMCNRTSRARHSPTVEKVEAAAERLMSVCERLANTPMNMSLGDWGECSVAMREAATTIAALVAERDEARAELASMKANWDANVYEMSERFRAVNIERMAKQVDQDAVIWCQEANARATILEEENTRLEEALAEALRKLRAALTGAKSE